MKSSSILIFIAVIFYKYFTTVNSHYNFERQSVPKLHFALNFLLLFKNVIDPVPLVRPGLLVPGQSGVPQIGPPGHRCSNLLPESPAQRGRHGVADLLQHLRPSPVELVTVGEPLDPRGLPH